MADTKHGSMEIKEQEKTFNGFLKFAGYGMLGAMVFLFLLYLVNG
ncbi:cytochrome C oxidase subunit IV [Marinosulfonomonas sp. PRT-SC04]|nr:cytochrome C oxidase subunit IV [Marinosulfonomonas sp. PRT-SC04]